MKTSEELQQKIMFSAYAIYELIKDKRIGGAIIDYNFLMNTFIALDNAAATIKQQDEED